MESDLGGMGDGKKGYGRKEKEESLHRHTYKKNNGSVMSDHHKSDIFFRPFLFFFVTHIFRVHTVFFFLMHHHLYCAPFSDGGALLAP
jgi:hypothetical protein